MDKLVSTLAVLLAAGFASCQYEQGRGGYQPHQVPNQPPANILLHKQALGQDGSFNYAFAADNGLQQGEVINPDGSRKGSYSYVDPNGKTISLSYTAGKDGFKVLNGDHLPKAPEPLQPRPNPQHYQQPPPQNQHYSQPPQPQPAYRPNPIPYEAYRNSPNAPAYRGTQVPYQEPYRHPQPVPPVPQQHYREPVQYEPQYRHPQQLAHFRPAPVYHHQPQAPPRHYSVQEASHEKPSPYLGDYHPEDPRRPHSFGNGYSFEFAG